MCIAERKISGIFFFFLLWNSMSFFKIQNNFQIFVMSNNFCDEKKLFCFKKIKNYISIHDKKPIWKKKKKITLILRSGVLFIETNGHRRIEDFGFSIWGRAPLYIRFC